MIFTTVGTHTAPFDRLTTAMDEVAGDIGEPVIMQIGVSRYLPRHAEWFRFASYERMQMLMGEARIVVCQGATTALLALRHGAAVVAMPRRSRFGESIDDHQVALAAKLAEEGLLTAVDDVTGLRDALSEVVAPDTECLGRSLESLASYITSWLHSVDSSSGPGVVRWAGRPVFRGRTSAARPSGFRRGPGSS